MAPPPATHVFAPPVRELSAGRRIGVFARVCCMAWLLIPAAFSQTCTWRNVEIGGGGFVTGTVFHPAEPGLVYARTDVGGAYRLDTATSRWIALNDDVGGLNNEFQHLGVLSIGLDPNNANRVYIATGQYAGVETWKLASRIYRSSDRGATWSHVTPGFKMAGNGEGRGTGERLAVDPVNGTNLLVGTSDSGIWRSADSGATWTRMSGFTPAACNFVIYAPANHISPGPNRRVYAAANTLTGQSFWYSDDNGTTWAEVPNHPGAVVGHQMMPLQGSFDAAGVFYMTWADATGPANWATDFGVWKLSADGATWTSIPPPGGQGFFAGICADPRVAGHVLVTTLLRWWPGDEVYRSTDGGATWTAALRTGTRLAGNSPWSSSVGPHWMTDIAIDPFNSDRAIFNTGFGLFQTTSLSASGTARTWTFFNDGLEELVPLGLLSPTAGPPLISVTGDYTGFRHDDLDRSPLRGRHSPGNGSNNIVVGAELAPSTMIRQNGDDTYFSQDAAATWSKFPAEPNPVINGAGRAVPSADGSRIIWCPPNAPAYFSSNNGTSWSLSANSSSANPAGNLTVSTLAGGMGIAGLVNNTGGNARFSGPAGVAVGPTGIRYVADTGNHAIRVIAAGESVSTLGGNGTAGTADGTGAAARFNSPSGLVYSAGSLFVADTANHSIRKVLLTGQVTTFAGVAGTAGSADGTGASVMFSSPFGIGADSAGNLFVADTGNHAIRKITSAGAVTTFAGAAGISGSANGNSTVARFNAPKGVVADPAGNLYVADTGNHVIRKITAAGAVTTFAGSPGTTGAANGTGSAARFSSPSGISADASGNLYVADTGNNAVRKITPTGAVTTLAGGAAGAANGTGSAASFQGPAGIAADAEGFNVYVADAGNHVIRRAVFLDTLTPVADRVDGRRIYLWDSSSYKLQTSTDGGASFSTVATGLNSAFAQLRAAPGKNGHLWARAGTSGLYQSTNFGASFTRIAPAAVSEVYQFDFGCPAAGASYPAIFIWGKVSGVVGFFRSDNAGSTWTRINDNLHQFGYINDMAGDPRVFGRVYLATSGRGVIVGDLPAGSPPASQASQVLYDDAPRNGWSDASPAGTNIASSSPLRRGTCAAAVPAGASNGVALACSAKSLSGYAAVSFWVYGDVSAPPPLQVGASRGGIALEAVPVALEQSPGWQRVVVMLADLGVAGCGDLTGLRIEGRTVAGVAPGAFSVDDIVLLGNDDFANPPAPVSITLGNLTATYDGTPKAVSVTTVPAGIPVSVTYNGSAIPPTMGGSYAVEAFVDDPVATGSATGTLVIAKANAAVRFGNLSMIADGTPKAADTTTTPGGLAVDVTYNGSSSLPVLAGSYAVVATINDGAYQGTATGTLVIRQPQLAATGLTGWASNNATASPSGNATSSPILNPNGMMGGAQNTLQAFFNPITLVNAGDKITLAGSGTLSANGTSGQSNWFRFGLYDNRGLAPGVLTGWLGYTGMGNSLYERLGLGAGNGLFSTGYDAVQRTPDSSPAPVSGTSPAGTPTIAFEVTVTRLASGVVVSHQLKRADTGATLMKYSYTDTSPNNNGTVDGTQNNASGTGYNPTYNAAGFAFGSTYVGNSTASAQFSNVQVSFVPGIPLVLSATEAWRQTYFGSPADSGSAADSADPDADGETNLMEFCTGQDPRAGTTAGATAGNSAGGIEFTYSRNRVAFESGYLFSVEWSDSLAAGTWTSVGPGIVVIDGSVQVVKATVPAAVVGRRFIRLRVSNWCPP